MKHKLEVEYEFDCLLFGVLCQVPIHTFCWYLNKELGLNLAHKGSHVVQKRGELSTYTYFVFEDDSSLARWMVLENHTENKTLVPELKKFDYIVKIDDPDHVNEGLILTGIRALAPVLGCYDFDIHSIKSKEDLLVE